MVHDDDYPDPELAEKKIQLLGPTQFGDTQSAKVLPGRYAYCRRVDDHELILTFQTVEELKAFMAANEDLPDKAMDDWGK